MLPHGHDLFHHYDRSSRRIRRCLLRFQSGGLRHHLLCSTGRMHKRRVRYALPIGNDSVWHKLLLFDADVFKRPVRYVVLPVWNDYVWHDMLWVRTNMYKRSMRFDDLRTQLVPAWSAVLRQLSW
jgi:hypothetical protein